MLVPEAVERGRSNSSRLRRALSMAVAAAAAGCSQGPAPLEAPLGRVDRMDGDGPARLHRLDLDSPAAASRLDALRACAASGRAFLWIDVGRSEALAAAKPLWVAGIGAHEDWRQVHPGAPRPGESTRVGVWPWTPIWYRAVLENRRDAIVKLLQGRDNDFAGVFLAHVQGAPSACGCGNDQCRWTVDYGIPGGPERVASSPSAELVRSLRRELPAVEWIPVWVTECEAADQPGEGSTGRCHTVHCFDGRCWQESAREMEELLAATDAPIALLATAAAFRRNPERYRAAGGWPAAAARLLEEVPPLHGRAPVPAGRLYIVVESTDAGAGLPDELRARCRGVVTLTSPIEQGWSPRLVPAGHAGE